jgi:UDP-N-acetylglucosamine 2-epimerase (non-hydrolysing)
MKLVKNCSFVLTDSETAEETTYLKIPCITIEKTPKGHQQQLRTNTLVHSIEEARDSINKVLNSTYKTGQIPEFWDGKAAERIIKTLKK